MSVAISSGYWRINDNFVIASTCAATTTDIINFRIVATQFDVSQMDHAFRAQATIHMPNGSYSSKSTGLETVNSVSHDFDIPLPNFGTVQAGTYTSYHLAVYDATGGLVAQSTRNGGGLCDSVTLTGPTQGAPPSSATGIIIIGAIAAGVIFLAMKGKK